MHTPWMWLWHFCSCERPHKLLETNF